MCLLICRVYELVQSGQTCTDQRFRLKHISNMVDNFPLESAGPQSLLMAHIFIIEM